MLATSRTENDSRLRNLLTTFAFLPRRGRILWLHGGSAARRTSLRPYANSPPCKSGDAFTIPMRGRLASLKELAGMKKASEESVSALRSLRPSLVCSCSGDLRSEVQSLGSRAGDETTTQ